jgi:hypothetical protein
MNSKHIGNITEVECMLAFMKAGYNVLIPYGDCERYDFVVDVNGKFYKIQVKTAHSLDDENSGFIFSCRSSHRVNGKTVNEKYLADEIDYFATIFNGQCYVIPQKECGAEKRLRLTPPKNGQTRGVSFAKDYELEVIIK